MKKVLVAEDEESIREFIVINLTRSGYNVEQAENGAVALEKFSQDENGFDVAILDIMMPKIDGYKVLASIRSAERKHGVSRMLRSKVIMTSALDEASFDSNLASDDYDDYICKPIDIMKFNDMLRKLLVIHDIF